ncbi:MAG: DNA gyrase subunit A [Anaerolineae bacterium]|jgi:DNA gyrase subunit A|nr:DNA gyrase subunit A [Anaerolineae bacterium]
MAKVNGNNSTSNSVQRINIEQEMRDAYLDYAMSVIVSRALPDARDGLKPVHRRILYAMYDMGVRADTPYKKSARIVGEVLGKYHPHGDGAVYESMVRMAQDFAMRYMLVDGQGNYGSIDGDSAAAMRYTEARMADIGEELLVDIGKDTVDFTENFDGSLEEPSVLPSSIPNLLVNGATGIAVGMSTNIPPHNLGEVCDALTFMLNRWDILDDLNVTDLMQFIKGPDFPTGGIVYRHQDANEEGEDTLVSAYATGRGKITIRAKAHIEDVGRGKSRIIISEIPYQVNKTSLIERIASLVRDQRLEGIADLRDESDRQGLRLVIELQRGAEPTEVLTKLFKLTPLQDTFSIIMLALVNNEPRVLSLKQALKVYLDHRLEVVRRRSEYDLMRARERAHILEGLLKAIDKLNKVITTIRNSPDAETARANLMQLLKISEIQAQAILDMQLRRLAALESQKIQEEFDEKVKLIEYLESLLQSPLKMRGVIVGELKNIKEAYGDKRRTLIADSTADLSNAAALLLPAENRWVMFSTNGRIARTHEDQPPKITSTTKNPPRFLLHATTNQVIYLFTADGRCATIPVQQIPEGEESGEGAAYYELSGLKAEDEVIAVISLPGDAENGYLFLASTNGDVKRIRINDLPGMTANVFTVINVGDENRLIAVLLTDGQQEILLTTNEAQAIRFREDDVRPTGLPAGGMRGIKLASQRSQVVAANLISQGDHVLTFTDDGVAKISKVEEYPLQGRAGGGVITMRLPKSSREIATAAIGTLEDRVIILSKRDKVKAIKFKDAPFVKRGASGGDILMSLTSTDQVKAAILPQAMYVDLPIEPNGSIETEPIEE